MAFRSGGGVAVVDDDQVTRLLLLLPLPSYVTAVVVVDKIYGGKEEDAREIEFLSFIVNYTDPEQTWYEPVKYLSVYSR